MTNAKKCRSSHFYWILDPDSDRKIFKKMNDQAGFMPVTHSHYLPTDAAFKAADMVEQPQALNDHCCSPACNGCISLSSLNKPTINGSFGPT